VDKGTVRSTAGLICPGKTAEFPLSAISIATVKTERRNAARILRPLNHLYTMRKARMVNAKLTAKNLAVPCTGPWRARFAIAPTAKAALLERRLCERLEFAPRGKRAPTGNFQKIILGFYFHDCDERLAL
jgi:hypothetical protein